MHLFDAILNYKIETQLNNGGGDAQNVDVDSGPFLDVDCRLKGFKKCRIYNKFVEK